MKPIYAAAMFIVMAYSYGCKPASRPSEFTTDSAESMQSKPPQQRTALAEKTEECTVETVLIAAKPGSPGNLIKSDINPNGDSELAVLMREMRDDLRNARDHLLREDSPASLLATHSKIRCSWPTDPNVRNAKFDRMAVSYLLAIEDLDRETTIADKKMAYGRALNACVTCHQNTCPGPISAIRALELPQ